MNMIQPPFTRTALLMLTCWSILSSAQDDPRFAKVSLFGANNYTVGLRDTPDGRSFCGGTLVTPRHVLTAGSCASTSVPYVSVGAYYAKGSKRNGSTEIPVSQTIVHPQLDNPLYANDIAILVLKVPVKSSLNIDYAQLMTSLCPEGTVGKISGWGNVDHHSSPRIPLKEDAVRVISREDCQEKLGVHYNVEIHESMLCADSGQASCNGDSGGIMKHDLMILNIYIYISLMTIFRYIFIYSDIFI